MKRFAALTLALFAAGSILAQPGGLSSTGVNASLLKMFGSVKAFSAKGEIRMTDNNGKEISALPVTMALLSGKLRTEMDMSEMKSGVLPPDAAAMLKATGMDRMQILIAPENKGTLVIYPGLQAYATVAEDQVIEGNVESTDLGKETIDGHTCIKRKVTATNAKGKLEEALVWAASDLKEFPLQMEMKQRKNTIHIHFTSPSFESPDAKIFEVPAGYTKYESIQGLMQAAMLKMFGVGK